MSGLTTYLITGLSTLIALPMLAFTGLTSTDPNCAVPATTSTVTATTSSGQPSSIPTPSFPTPTIPTPTITATMNPAGEGDLHWDAEQLADAAIIVTVGQAKAVPPWGWVIAVATAIQESRLRNLPGGDRDSIGLFQQRPSQGWGTPTRLTDPTYQAGKFYDALLAVRGWQQLPLTVAAQAVQRSAFPNAYAKWTDDAVYLVTLISGQIVPGRTDVGPRPGNPGCSFGDDGLHDGATVSLPSGFTLPTGTPPAVVRALGWAIAQLGTPYSYGGDCTAPHSGDPARDCDCSSLVQQAYHAAGITLPRTTAEQAHAGQPVPSRNQLKPGDLVFIPGSHGTPTAPGHVGLYLGDGLIIHAPHTGDVIRLANISDWAPSISMIRRVDSALGAGNRLEL